MELAPSVIGILGFVVLFALIILTRMPIGFAFAFVGVIGISHFVDFQGAILVLTSTVWAQSSSYVLMAVPLFILMGQFASYSGIGKDLYAAAHKWLGRLPGGLAIATIWGGAGFAACTGSSTSGVLTFGPIAYSPMIDAKYDRRLALGSICCGATMGSMIPPSIMFIVYASVTEESTGQLFMAGIVPGLIEAVFYTIVIILLAGLGIWSGPAGGSSTWREKLTSLRGIWGSLSLFILVIGGIYMGFFTPTEAAGVGAMGALVILVTRKGVQLTPTSPVWLSLKETLRTSCMIYTLLIGGMVFARFVALSGLSTIFVETVVTLEVSPFTVVGIVLGGFLLLGCIMPSLPLIVLTVPFLYPVFVDSFGFSGVWFGVLVVVMMEIAFVTPPIGINLFVTKSLFRDVPIGDIFRGVVPFVLCDVLRAMLLWLFPAICLWLPSRMLTIAGQ